MFYFYLLVLFISLTSCVAVGKKSFVRSPNYSSDKTIKVVALNTSDLILGRMEHYLLENGLPVISDNYLRGAVPTGMGLTVQSSDTTYTIPQYHPVALQLFEEKPTDYILKYEYNSGFSANKQSFTYFNARLINSKTGAFDVSFTFTQGNLGWGKRKVDKVLSTFARALAGN